ncbi:DUF637 domain-containing protein [Cupriavidus basilensis]
MSWHQLALAGMASSAVSHADRRAKASISAGWVEAGAVGAITAGLTNGITLDGAGNLGFNTGVNVAGPARRAWPAWPAGGSNVSGAAQAAKDGATGALWQQGAAILGTGLISAGVGNAFYGGSFGNALTTNLITQGAALGAFAIGEDIPGIGDSRATADTRIANVLVHAALGCASSAALLAQAVQVVPLAERRARWWPIGLRSSSPMDRATRVRGNWPLLRRCRCWQVVVGWPAGTRRACGRQCSLLNETLNNTCAKATTAAPQKAPRRYRACG